MVIRDAMDNPTTLIDVANWAYSHLVEILLIVGIFVEITPIKINPISWLCGILLKPVRKDMQSMKAEINENIENVKVELKKEIDSIKSDQQAEGEAIQELIKTNELSEISRIRWEIIEFANSLENGQLHIRDEYRHIIDDNSRYHSLIEKHNMTNGVIDEEYSKIKDHYEENKHNTSVYF